MITVMLGAFVEPPVLVEVPTRAQGAQAQERNPGLCDLETAQMAPVARRRAALLHDIGKLSVPNRILDKPDRLEPDEWEIVKRHPYFTYESLARVPVFSEFAYDASCHHERLDGQGYYRGVVAESLSVPARIMATADVFDALSAARPYRGPLPLDQVMTIMLDGRGSRFCPATPDALLATPYVSASGQIS